MTAFVLVLQLLAPPDPAATLWLVPPGELALRLERQAGSLPNLAPAAPDPDRHHDGREALEGPAFAPPASPVPERRAGLAWPRPGALLLSSVYVAATDAGAVAVAALGFGTMFGGVVEGRDVSPLYLAAGLGGLAALIGLPPAAASLGARRGGEPRTNQSSALLRGNAVRLAGAGLAAVFFRNDLRRAGWTTLAVSELVLLPAVVAGTLAAARATPEQDPALLR